MPEPAADAAVPDDRELRTVASADELGDDVVVEDALLTGFRLEGRRVRRARFVDCVWRGVDLTGCAPEGWTLQGCRFEECKALAIDWTVVRRITACEFRECVLDDAAFPAMPLRGLVLRDCRLRRALLAGADLTEACLCGSELTGATFGRTTLTRADLRGARGFVLNPAENAVAGLRVSADAVPGLLSPFGVEID